jgi:uncharacterized protein DUF5615
MSGSSGKIERPPRFLADENFETAIVQGVKRQRPGCVFLTADEAGIRNLPDDLVLRRAQELVLILVSHDRRTMYDHFATFLMSMGADQHSPGVFLVSQERFSLGQLIDFIIEIYDLSDHAEWRDRIVDLPLQLGDWRSSLPSCTLAAGATAGCAAAGDERC